MLKPPKALSPSATTTYLQCPLKFKYSKIDRLPEPKSDALVRGSFVHDILDHLFRLPADDRTKGEAQQIARRLWDEEWEGKTREVLGSASTKEYRDFRWSAWWCVENYFAVEDPTIIVPKGRESWVEGLIDGVKMRGIIDRWTMKGTKATITDYKTGATPGRAEWAKPYELQIMIYVPLLEKQEGLEVGKAELIYLKDGNKKTYTPTEKRRQSMQKTVASVWEGIEGSCKTGEFETRKSKLCDWCSFKNICPAWE